MMTDLDHKDDQIAVTEFAQDAVVADAIASAVSELRTEQWRAGLARVIEQRSRSRR